MKFIRWCINTPFGRRCSTMSISFVANILNAKKLNLDHNQTNCILIWMYLTNLRLIYLGNLFLIYCMLKTVNIVFLGDRFIKITHFIGCNKMDDIKHVVDLLFKGVVIDLVHLIFFLSLLIFLWVKQTDQNIAKGGERKDDFWRRILLKRGKMIRITYSKERMIFLIRRTNPFEDGEDDKNHGVSNGPITWSNVKRFTIDFKFVSLSIKVRQHLLESFIFNYIKFVRVKWSIWLCLLWRLKGIGIKSRPQTSFVGRL